MFYLPGQELLEATDGFREELGKGAFGVVYKGAMEMGSSVLVAVKKLNSSFQIGRASCRERV